MKPLRVAIVGAGPAGLYAAGHLLEGPGGTYLDGRLVRMVNRPVEVDVFDRLPTHWGLVRHGVAPDHPEKKLVQTVFEQVAARRGFRFFGNVEVGRHVSAADLSRWYDAVIYANGAASDATLGIDGEDLPGSVAAREFVAWYNGHPDYRDLDIDLSHERAVVVGNGNVALDVARILTLPIAALERTDIADHALRTLRASRVREVVVLGRRGPAEAAFSNPELEELGRLPSVDIVVAEPVVVVAEPVVEEPSTTSDDPAVRRKLATLRNYARRTSNAPKRIVLRFHTSPTALLGDSRVRGVALRDNRTGEHSELGAGLVLRAIGYRGIGVPGLPFDEQRGIVENVDGRVTGMVGTYVTGWIKRGPRGIIGTNKKCARDTVRALLAVADHLDRSDTLDAAAVEAELRHRRPDLVTHEQWLRIDAAERAAGRPQGRPRIKFSDVEELLAAAQAR